MTELVIRADANARIGTGHVLRCLALAQAWHARGGHATFVMASGVPALPERLQREGAAIVHMPATAGTPADAEFTASLAHGVGAQWLVLDGYQFDAVYQHAIKDAGVQLLCIDDNADAAHYYADLVLNQNLHADASMYAQREPHTELLLGTRYVLLRREFWRWRGWERTIPDVARRMLVTFGGADPDNLTLCVVKALEHVQVEGLEIVVVIGSANPHSAEIGRAAAQSAHRIRVEQDVSDMPARMAWAEVAISGAGSTCWELAFMGLPALVAALAENQSAVAVELARRGIVQPLNVQGSGHGRELAAVVAALLEDSARRSAMSEHGRVLVDGQGVQRVADMLEIAPLTLCPVTARDCELLWQWANDPLVRANSFSSEPIAWEQHVRWFSEKLQDPDARLYLVCDACAHPIGQVRFQIQHGAATISLSLAQCARGKGRAARMIALGARELFASTSAETIHAYIKPENLASIRAFERAGFRRLENCLSGDHFSAHLILEKHESV